MNAASSALPPVPSRREAERARVNAARRLAQVEAQSGRVERVAGLLTQHLEENHFAERFAAAFGRTEQ